MAHSPQQVPRNRSISAGASELPQHEHKRPRLDTQIENPSTMEPHNEETLTGLTGLTQPGTEIHPRPQTPPMSQPTPSLVVSPTSKVTINTRPLSAQSLSHGNVIDPEQLTATYKGDPIQARSNSQSTSHADSAVVADITDSDVLRTTLGDADDPISIGSSPSEATIETGAPEDVEASVGETSSYTSSSAEAEVSVVSLWETFPYSDAQTKSEILKTMGSIAEVFEKDQSDQFASVFLKVSEWMESLPKIFKNMDFHSRTDSLELLKQIPTLVKGLTQRRVAVPTSISETDILNLVKNFASLALHVIDFDIEFSEIVQGSNIQSWFWSEDFISLMAQTIQPEQVCNLYKVLRNTRQIQTPDLLNRVVLTLFQEEPHRSFQALAMLFSHLVLAVPTSSQSRLFIPKIVSYYRIFLTATYSRKIVFDSEQKKVLCDTTSNFVIQAEEALQQAISKQHQWLTIDNSGICLEHFSRLNATAVTVFADMAEDVFVSASLDPEQFQLEEMVHLVSEAYRLSLLRKFIQQGRMELKVSGIETMASLLVELWNRITHSTGLRKSSLLDLVIGFLRNSELVKYILSVDCHPQIVQRSANVIGFLCVSDHWQSTDSDLAWQAVLGSQDHRSVTAVLGNLQVNLQHLTLEALIYLYGKVKEVPFDKFDNGMFQFTTELLNATMTKAMQVSGPRHHVNTTIVSLCLHLLRESNAPEFCDTDIANRIREHILQFVLVRERQSFGQNHIMDLADVERNSLVHTIELDVRSHSTHATGSILVMTALLSSLDDTTVAAVVISSGFAGLLLDDLIHLSRHHHLDASRSQKSLGIETTARMNNLCYLIQRTPAAFSREMCESFWINILTCDVQTIRSNAWSSLAGVYRHMNSLNQVLEFVATQFMQHLPRSQFDRSVLGFCQASVEFEIRHGTNNLTESDEYLQIPAMEKVWKIMLEVPEVEVQDEASSYIIRTYLCSNAITSRSFSCIQNTHSALVDRCIQTVIESASVLSSSEDGVRSQELISQSGIRIQRSLDLLRKFLKELKTKNEFKPTVVEAYGAVLKTFPVRGTPLEHQLRVNGTSNLRDGQLTWVIGEDNTGHELWQFLTEMLGWSQIIVVRAGARLNLEGDETSVKDLRPGIGPFQVMKQPGASDTGPGKGVRSTSPLDTTIMHHFRNLYELLDLPHAAAKPVYEFLTVFSSQENVIADIKSMTSPATSLLPVQKPFKLLYYANALRSCIEEESFSPTPNVLFLQYAVHTIVTTLGHLQTVQKDQAMYLTILSGIIETLQLALRAKVPESTSSSYFKEPQAFVTDFLGSWQVVHMIEQASIKSAASPSTNRHFLDVVVEAALHEPRLWQFLDEDDRMSRLFDYAVLYDVDTNSRISVLEVICKLAGVSPGKLTSKVDDLRSPKGRFPAERVESCLQHVWHYLKPLITEACRESSTCEQAVEASVAVYDTVSKKLEADALMIIFEEVRDLLFAQHNPNQHVYCENEKIPFGLAKLLSRTVTALGALEVSISDAESLARAVYQQLLFPPLSDHRTACIRDQKTPLLNMETRTALYDLLALLCQNPRVVYTLAAELDESMIDKDAFNLVTSNERKALKSSQDYAGLRNLSNTCYLNSLFSQLFMNVKFRQLIIGMSTSDDEKQKLIRELGNVFANMQCSYEKYVDPEDAVDSITQYTGEQIDVTVQMDVDEFFNLLFDRLEAQITDSSVREAFKAMYGGQLVQQIKSKECEHVSERLEPFSAVQIEIKGKSGLQEGLAAYVEGEVLQGENKYSCTGCGRHVDAVKRACLKEIPDNLIFNLKRFDYDIMTGMRCKVNDEFQFPDVIDMMPYTVDALSNPDHQLPPDMFELVGVIVHSGTAETGHYYSFVRQRPSVLDSKNSWMQFNDQDVTSFDLAQMKDQAFGGCDPSYNNFAKFYNGYMLFYQRSTSIRAYEQEFAPLKNKISTQVRLPLVLDNSIAQENEISLRRYVAQDASHARFVRQIAERVQIPNEPCSRDHQLEDNLLGIVLEYVQQVSSRWKEAPEFEDTIKVLCGYAKSCTGCALYFVEWFNTGKTLIDTILKAFYPSARKNFALLLQISWTELSPLRHSDKQQDIHPTNRKRMTDALSGCLQKIKEDWNQLQRFNRGWEQLFGTLRSVVKLGKTEADAVIESDLLGKILEIIWVHQWPTQKGTPTGLRMTYNVYLAAKEKNRLFHYTSLMDLFADLLPYVCLDSAEKRETFELTDSEKTLFALSGPDNIEWLRRMIAGNTNVNAANRVVKELCGYPNLAELTASTLLAGLTGISYYVIAIRFLHPCYVFTQHCKDRKIVMRVIKHSLRAIAETDGYYGSDYLEYVKALSSLTTAESLASDIISKILVSHMGYWAPILLLANDDMHADVRGETLNLLHRVFFRSFENVPVDEVRADSEIMKSLRSLLEGCCTFVSKHLSTSSASQETQITVTSGQTKQMLRVLEEGQKYAELTEDAEEEILLNEIQQTIQHLTELERSADMQDLDWEREPSSEAMSDSEVLEHSP